MFQSLLDETNAAVLGFVFRVWTEFNIAANTWLTLMMILFIVIVGYLLLVGRIEMSLQELFPRVFKLLFIFVLITNVGALVILVYNLFVDIPEGVATFLVTEAGGTEIGVNGTIELVYVRGMTSARNIFDQGGVNNMGAWLLGLVVAGITIAAIVYVLFLLMLSKLAVAVLLAVAPFFLVLYLFDAARPVFEGWLRQLISFALIPVFLYALLALILNLAEGIADTLLEATRLGTASFVQIAPFCVVMLVTLLLTGQVQGWAAGVGGGFSLSSGASRAAGAAVGAATGGAGAVAAQLYQRSGMASRVQSLSNRMGTKGWNQRSGTRGGSAASGARGGPSSSTRNPNSWQDRQRRDRQRN